MRVEMRMPQMGESITEATVIKWLKNPGDPVAKDEHILEITTDKVDSEIPSPACGVLVQVLCRAGEVVPVKSVIAIIETNGKAPEQPAAQDLEPPEDAAAGGNRDSGKKIFSPAVLSLAAQRSVSADELAEIRGSGLAGRITKQDVLRYVESKASACEQSGPERIVMMDPMRRAIAEHMVRSRHTSPHVYSVQEADLTAVAAYIKKHKAEFHRLEGVNLTYTPFFFKAVARVLPQLPYLNCSIEGDRIILKDEVNLGCAVALNNEGHGAGVVVPVIRRADKKSLADLAKAVNDLAVRVRNKTLMPDEVAGGTFTVTNLGASDAILGTPIINQPQVAILAIGVIKKRPVVVDDEIAIRPMCYLTLGYDHRIVDGMLAGEFLSQVRKYLESWDINRPFS